MLKTTVPLAALPFVTAPPVIEPVTSCPNAAVAKTTIPTINPNDLIFIQMECDDFRHNRDVLILP